MPTLLLNLRHVPDDEAEEIRALLREHHIDFYETQPGPWGISMGGIWSRDDDQAEVARQLLEAYQHDRQRRMRAEYERRKREGEVETVMDRLRDNPVGFLACLALIGAILYLMLKPFLTFATG